MTRLVTQRCPHRHGVVSRSGTLPVLSESESLAASGLASDRDSDSSLAAFAMSSCCVITYAVSSRAASAPQLKLKQ